MDGQKVGKSRHGGRVKQGNDIERGLQVLLEFVHKNRPANGVAPQVEEVVMDPHPVKLQDLAPEASEELFQGPPRCHVGLFEPGWAGPRQR